MKRYLYLSKLSSNMSAIYPFCLLLTFDVLHVTFQLKERTVIDLLPGDYIKIAIVLYELVSLNCHYQLSNNNTPGIKKARHHHLRPWLVEILRYCPYGCDLCFL